MLLRQTFLLPLASFHNFIIPNSSTLYCTSLKMLSSFLDHFGTLLALANLLNGGFRLHFLCNFLITLAYPSTIFLPVLLLCPLRHPPAVPHATGGSSTTPSLPLLAIPTADGQLETLRHRSAWFANRYGWWPLPPAPQRSTPYAPLGGYRARESRTTFLVHQHLVCL